MHNDQDSNNNVAQKRKGRTMKTKAVWTNESVLSGDFGVVDDKGRMIGYQIKLFDVEYVAFVEGDNYAYCNSHQPGKYFAFYPHATRNGNTYGACQQKQEYSTKAEREEAIKKYIDSARKRNQRKIQKIFQEF